MNKEKKYWYIVWRYEHLVYRREQGGGYYGGYKDKLSDNWTDIPMNAKKYSSLGGAMARVGLPDKIHDIDKFWEDYGSESAKRTKKLNKILSIDETSESDIFRRGRIDIIYEDGEVVKFGGHPDVLKKINDIVTKTEKRKKVHCSDYETPNIVTDDGEGDFWEGF